MMPLWHHPGENREKRQENNSKTAKCLRSNHATLTVGNGLDVAQRLVDPLHSNRASCMCDDCDDDRTIRGCENPHACAAKAISRMGQIHPKWIPKPGDAAERVTVEHVDRNENSVLFEPPIAIERLSQGMRAMTLRTGEPGVRPEP